MGPFDVAWALLKSYTSSPATPDGKIVPSFQGHQPQPILPIATRQPQESDEGFREQVDYIRSSPAMQRRVGEHSYPYEQFIFEDAPTAEEPDGEVGHAANFDTATTLNHMAKVMGTGELYNETGMVPGDSQFTSYEE